MWWNYKVILSHPPQDTSVTLTQSFGQMSPPTASALSASSPALSLSVLRAKSVVLREEAPVGFPPLGHALYTATQTAALLMECCSASWPPAPTHWLRPAHPPRPCPCSVLRWSMSRTGTHLCQPFNRSLWRLGPSECPCWKGRHVVLWWDTLKLDRNLEPHILWSHL